DRILERPSDDALTRLLALQPDGKILVNFAGHDRNGQWFIVLARLNPDGSRDPGFAPRIELLGSDIDSSGLGVRTTSLAVQPDGKIVVSGYFDRVDGIERRGLARLNPDGSLDSTFEPPPDQSFFGETLVLHPDGQIDVIGRYGYVIRLNGDNRRFAL